MPKLDYDVNVNADTSDVNDVTSSIDRMGDSLDDISRDTQELTERTRDATEAQEDMADSAGGLTDSLKGFIALGAAAVFAAIAAAAIAAAQAGNDWVRTVGRISKATSGTLEESSALLVSFTKAGVGADEALGAIDGVLGGITSAIEAQIEQQEELNQLSLDRIEIINEMAQAEIDHAENVTELEMQISRVGAGELEKRNAQRDEALADVQKNHQKFLDEQRRSEQRQTERLEDEWADRVRAYQRSVLEAQEDFTEDSSRATSARELDELERALQKKLDRLGVGLDDERTDQQRALDGQVKDREEATRLEIEAINEKSAAIQAKADEDLSKIQERNEKQVASLLERIDKENESFADQQSGFREGLEEISKAQADAMAEGGDLAFIMERLGVKMLGADGKIRPVVDIIWDMKDALAGMHGDAERAGIISDLGWQDFAGWIDSGLNRTEALRKAKGEGLTVTQEMLEALSKQDDILAEIQLKYIGIALRLFDAADINEGIVWIMTKINDAIQITIDLFNQVVTIVELLFEKLQPLWEGMRKGADAWSGILDMAGFNVEGGGGVGGLFSDLTGGNLGGVSVGGLAPGGAPLTIEINGNVFGVEDIKGAINDALTLADNQAVRGGQ